MPKRYKSGLTWSHGAELEARVVHTMIRYVTERPVNKYKIYPALDDIARQEGWTNGFKFGDICWSHLGERPQALWRKCREADSLDPIHAASLLTF